MIKIPHILSFWNVAKAVLKGRCIVLNTNIIKEGKNNPKFSLKKLKEKNKKKLRKNRIKLNPK